jgi:hypothetical protein
VTIDGHHAHQYDARVTNRGLEVAVWAKPGRKHTLTVTTG